MIELETEKWARILFLFLEAIASLVVTFSLIDSLTQSVSNNFTFFIPIMTQFLLFSLTTSQCYFLRELGINRALLEAIAYLHVSFHSQISSGKEKI